RLARPGGGAQSGGATGTGRSTRGRPSRPGGSTLRRDRQRPAEEDRVKHLDVALAARAHRGGRALRTSAFRHRRLVQEPRSVVLWQLGAEPFTAAAIGWGTRPDRLGSAVAGDPRNRDLAFAALLKFARWFNPLFESHAARRETVTRGDHT